MSISPAPGAARTSGSTSGIAGPDLFERILGGGALLMLALVFTALAKGFGGWAQVPLLVWAHMVTVVVALLLTPAILWRRRGDTRHRWMGYVWAAAMGITAFASLFIRIINPGGFSLIHVLSLWTLLQLVLIIRNARAHRWPQHRRAVRLMTLGALMIAGAFTLLPSRLLGHWLLG